MLDELASAKEQETGPDASADETQGLFAQPKAPPAPNSDTPGLKQNAVPAMDSSSSASRSDASQNPAASVESAPETAALFQRANSNSPGESLSEPAKPAVEVDEKSQDQTNVAPQSTAGASANSALSNSLDSSSNPLAQSAPAIASPFASIIVTAQKIEAAAADHNPGQLSGPFNLAVDPLLLRTAAERSSEAAKPTTDAASSDQPQSSDQLQGNVLTPEQPTQLPTEKPLAVSPEPQKQTSAVLQKHTSLTDAPSDSVRSIRSLDDLLATAASQSAAQAASGAASSAATHAHAGTAPIAAATVAPQAQLAPIPLSGIPVLIAAKALEGGNHFDIRLDPPELGRIEVRLKVDRDGQVSSHLIAERAETLALLRRDQSGLERALQDAGLKTTGDGLQFSLRDQSGNGQTGDRSASATLFVHDPANPAPELPPRGYVQYAARTGGIDIHV
jgi:flagellar hook-length control protein FliK